MLELSKQRRIRHDAYADAQRIPTEEMKPVEEQGHYLHPELFGAPSEEAVGYRAPGQSRNAAAHSRVATVGMADSPANAGNAP